MRIELTTSALRKKGNYLFNCSPKFIIIYKSTTYEFDYSPLTAIIRLAISYFFHTRCFDGGKQNRHGKGARQVRTKA